MGNRTEHQHEIHPYPWSSGTRHSSPTVWKHRRWRRSESAPEGPCSEPSVSCRTEYTTLWDTEYIETETEECNTVYVNSCNLYKKRCSNVPKQECRTVQDKQCSTVYNEVCVEKYRTEYEAYTETKCRTEYKDDCEYQWEGEGNAKVWVPILEPVNPTPMIPVRMFPGRRRGRFPTLCATRFQYRSVSMSRKRSASLFRSRSAPMNPTRIVIRFPSRTASLFTRKFQTESAEGFPRRSVMMVRGLDMVLKHPGREV